MSKLKYLALLAVAVMFISVFSVWGLNIGGDMPDLGDDERHPIYQTNIPPIIDGNVEVGVTWPAGSWVGETYIANQGGGIPTSDVYMLFGNLAGYVRTDNPPLDNYGKEDWTGYYLYIGIKARTDDGYSISSDGNWLVIDWDQDDVIDFADHNGESAGKGKKGGWATQYAWSSESVEWAIPYIDDFDGLCESPFSIMIHIEIVKPEGGTETTTFPDRPPGHFESWEMCPWEFISPEPPEPEPGDWGIRTIGFWRHQFLTALGWNKGHNHIDYETLLSYTNYISSESDVPEIEAIDSDLIAALGLLESAGPRTMYEKAVQQLFAVWLNYVANGDLTVPVDIDEDPDDDTLSEVIAWAEEILIDPDSTHEDLEEVKDTCDDVNNSAP